MIARLMRWISIIQVRCALRIIGCKVNEREHLRWRHYIETGVILEEYPE